AARHRLFRRALPRALRDPQLAGAGAALHGTDARGRARLRRDPVAARHRRPGQPADHPRPAAEERLRLLHRLAALLARGAPPALGSGRGAEGETAPAAAYAGGLMYLRSD